MDFCCEKLEKETNDEYSPFYLWGSTLYCEGKYAKTNGMNTRKCNFCPFCGKELK